MRRGTPYAAPTVRLQGLRRTLVQDGGAPADSSHAAPDLVVCVDLATSTITRYADQLPTLLADLRSFGTSVASLGILPESGLNADTAALGCDVYASADQAPILFDTLTADLAMPRRARSTSTARFTRNERMPGAVPESWFRLHRGAQDTETSTDDLLRGRLRPDSFGPGQSGFGGRL